MYRQTVSAIVLALILISVFTLASNIPDTTAVDSGEFWATAYYCVYGSEMDGTQTSTLGISGSTYTLKASFLFGGHGVAMQGTGRTGPGGDYVHYVGSGGAFVSVDNPVEDADVRARYAALGITDFTGFGNIGLAYPSGATYSIVSAVTGASGRALVPWYSIAVDPSTISLGITGTLLFKSGATTPSGATEMGFRADDTGGAITGNRIDVYVGESMSALSEWVQTGGNRYVEVMRGHALDVYMLVDLSGSFGDDLPIFKVQAPNMIANLKVFNPGARFGLGKFEDYPISPFGSAPDGDKAYERIIDLTSDTDAVLSCISGLFCRYGDDAPQSQLAALYQAATGAGQDLSGVGFPGASIPPGQQANFRDGARKLFILWTDAPFHNPGDPGAIPYPGPSFDETVDAIKSIDPPIVIGISSGSGGVEDLRRMAAATGAFAPTGGVDTDGDGMIDILEGEPLVCTISSSGDGISEAIESLVEAAAILPIADANGPYEGKIGNAIAFYGGSSYDSDGFIALYEWDFEGDGTFDFNFTESSATHIYGAVFDGIVVLRVTDNEGNTATDEAAVKIDWSIVGDISGDGVVDIYDLVLVSGIYGSKIGDPAWNPVADLADPYGIIDILDLVTVAGHYGERAP